MYIDCMGNQITLRFRIWYDKDHLDPMEAFFEALNQVSAELNTYFCRRVHRCRGCKGDRSDECAVPVRVCGGTIKLCEHWSRALMWDARISMDEVSLIDQILDAVRMTI